VPNKKGKLFVITGPSGAGKDSVIEEAKKLGLKFGNVVTSTSRKPRGQESENNPYHFLSKKEFEKAIKEKKFVEYVEWCGHYYGTAKKDVNEALEKNQLAIARIDPVGARSYKKMMPESIAIFISPPSLEHLEKRLKSRKTDSRESIKARLEKARKEMNNLSGWDYVVVNEEGKLKEAALKVKKIIEGSAKKKTGRIILFLLGGFLIVLGYLFLFGLSHPGTKQTARKLVQKITIPLEVNSRFRQAQAILSFIPDSAASALLVNFSAAENFSLLLPNMVNPNFEPPSISEALIISQPDSAVLGVVFKLENPPEQNWEKFQRTVRYLWANKYPSQVTRTLPDNSQYTELVPDLEKITPESSNYEGQEIRILAGEGIALAYSQVGNYVIISANPTANGVKEAIYQIMDANKKPEKRAILKDYKRCVEENPYKLTLFKPGADPAAFLVKNPALSLFFGQNRLKSEKCI